MWSCRRFMPSSSRSKRRSRQSCRRKSDSCFHESAGRWVDLELELPADDYLCLVEPADCDCGGVWVGELTVAEAADHHWNDAVDGGLFATAAWSGGVCSGVAAVGYRAGAADRF